MLDNLKVKEIARSLGADLCGIAGVDRFSAAPDGYHPRDVFPICKSVISFACRFPVGTLLCRSDVPYTRARNSMSARVDDIALRLCVELERNGARCIPIPANEAQLDTATGRKRSIVSLKHAAQAAGLGTIGRHSLLITPEFGSMVWLGGVLCEMKLEPDEMKPPVCDQCNICVNICPVNALENAQVDQHACMGNVSVDDKEKGIWVLACHRCRDSCPYNFGTLNSF